MPIFVARHAPFRQHAHRADSGQPPTGPRRRRTDESGSCGRVGVGLRRPAGSFSALRRAHSTPTACGGWARLIWQACRRWPTARRGSPTRCRRNFLLCRFDPPDPAQCPDHPHLRDPVDTCVSCFSRLFTSRPGVQLRPGRVGPLLPLVPRADGTLAIGSAGRRHARRRRTRTWSTTWKSKPGG